MARYRDDGWMNGDGVIVMLGCFALAACQAPQAAVDPTITLTQLPPAGDGSPDRLHTIAGRVTAAGPGHRIVLFARAGVWWIQPTSAEPFTPIQADSTWKNSTHPGSAYAALLVTRDYQPPATTDALPKKGGAVLAVAVADGPALARPEPKTLRFSGYDWTVREAASDRGGTRNFYDPANAWVDSRGHLHLRIARKEDGWTAAEVTLTRSLGYGTYRLRTREISHLEPAAVFSMFTWDDDGPPREMNIEVSRWGEINTRNAQFIVQPYYVPANATRFQAPAGPLTFQLLWESGRATFESRAAGGRRVAGHVFTSGVPAPGNESIHLNLYVFDNKRNPLRQSCEVVIETFEYLP